MTDKNTTYAAGSGVATLSTSGSGSLSYSAIGPNPYSTVISTNPYSSNGSSLFDKVNWTIQKTSIAFCIKPSKIHDVMNLLCDKPSMFTLHKTDLIMGDDYESSEFKVSFSVLGNTVKEVHDMITNKSLRVLSLTNTNATIKALGQLFVELDDEFTLKELSYS
jgi:hypothetical protein